ncbi:TPA: type IV conjugative transfer system protein TraE [Yersinia enterocolitica]
MDLSARRSTTKFVSLVFILLLFFLGLSLAGNLFAWMQTERLINSREETYIPMMFDAPFTLSRNHADSNYLQQTAESFLFLRLNVTPENVAAQHASLLRFFSSEDRVEMTKVLKEEENQIVTNNVTSAFYASEFKVYPASGVIDMQGELKTWLGNKPLPSEHKSYRLTLHYRNGVTQLKSFKESVDAKTK